MRVMSTVGWCGALLWLALPAFAQQTGDHLRFRWTDDGGHLHLSDTLPADSARFGYDLINQYGHIVRHVDGSKTAVQLAAENAQAASAETAAKQRRADHQLLLAYPTEKALIASQDERKHVLHNTIASTEANMKSQLDALAAMLDQAAAYSQRGDTVPRTLKQRVDKQRSVVRKQRQWVRKKQVELTAFTQQAHDQLQHYRSLRQDSTQSVRTAVPDSR